MSYPNKVPFILLIPEYSVGKVAIFCTLPENKVCSILVDNLKLCHGRWWPRCTVVECRWHGWHAPVRQNLPSQ